MSSLGKQRIAKSGTHAIWQLFAFVARKGMLCSAMLGAMIAPDRIAIENDGAELSMSFADDPPLTFSAGRLRAACKCAHCQRARIEDRFPVVAPDLTIVTVRPQGHFGINIAFSDGHARGIYPWSYLSELATP